jgi:manganese-dependent ADP-ribose/CDP-alcohol diphosphatase
MRKKVFALILLPIAMLVAGGCKRVVEFGVVADIQYHPGEPQGTRHYSASLGKLKEALSQFNREKVRFVVNLGDTIDHHIQSFDAVRPLFMSFEAPVYHVIGNHDYDVQPGDEARVMPALGLKESYYAFDTGKWLFILLNGFELRYPFPADEALKRESEALYWSLCAQGKENAQRWNGGIGLKQIAWLGQKLEEAEVAGKNVLVFCHFPVLPEAGHNLWNDSEIVALLEKHRPVKAYFSGHNHAGGYAFRNGIHYLTFTGMVETPDKNAFAIVTLEKDAIRVNGFGREPSRTLPILIRDKASSPR